jgi:organic hydroperoxide reductase OsmC/OhrA
VSIFKELQFPVSVHFDGGRIVRATPRDAETLVVATPPEFRSGVAGHWSPEDLLVASAATCYAVTFVAIAERREVPVYALDVTGTGHLSKRDDGSFGFVAIELTARVETAPEFAPGAERVGEFAEEGCLVANALDVPVHVDVVVATPEAAGVAG